MSADEVVEERGSTRERLLKAAADLFARHGRERVSIRDIAAAAGVQHGGINYHFRSKDELYHEVLMRFGPAAVRSVFQLEIPEGLSPEDARELFARIVRQLVEVEVQEMDPVAAGLLRAEIAHPDGPNELLFERVIQPHHRGMTGLIGQMFPARSEAECEVAAFNVMSQCVFLRVARPVALKLLGATEFDDDLTALVAQRIITTALHGLGAPAEEQA